MQGNEELPTRPLGSRRWTQDQEDEFLKEVKDWEVRDSKAHSAIVRTITPEVSLAVQTLDSASEVWNKLESLYARYSSMRAVTLQGQLYSLSYTPRTSMQSFLMKAKMIHDQLLLAMNAALTSSQLSALLLTKLPQEYDIVARALRCQVTSQDLDFDDLSSLLLEEECVLSSQIRVPIVSSDQVFSFRRKFGAGVIHAGREVTCRRIVNPKARASLPQRRTRPKTWTPMTLVTLPVLLRQ